VSAPRLVGYTDRLSVRPGDVLRFYVSSDYPRYDCRLVRLLHGDTNPLGPGFRQELVASDIDGEYSGRVQTLPSGSYADLPLATPTTYAGVGFGIYLQPWDPDRGDQVIASHGGGDVGWSVGLDVGGELFLAIGAVSQRIGLRVDRWQWYHLLVSLDIERRAGQVYLRELRRGRGLGGYQASEIAWKHPYSDPDPRLVLAAGLQGKVIQHFDGKLDEPVLYGRSLTPDDVSALASSGPASELADAIRGRWDLGVGAVGDIVVDASGQCPAGRLINAPTRGVTGHNFSGRETSFRLAPDEYGAAHFHRDDVDDAGWEQAFALTVPASLPSGVYAAWLTADGEEEYLPFVVPPPRGTRSAKVAVLFSTMTYLVYENFTDLGKAVWANETYAANPATHPYADRDLNRDAYRYIDETALYGPYDTHLDGSATVFASLLRPIVNMRPKFRYRTLAAPARFAADLYLVDWLDHVGIAADFITDHELHAEGADLLAQYNVVISSTHHEYWTQPMLDGLEEYLFDGGRFMYLGGNGLYGVVSQDPHHPHRVEVRRWGTSWPFECAPAERYHITTGEPGGTWRNRGRSPHGLVGIGTAGAGFDRGSPYMRNAEADAPTVRFIFDGLDADELIGDVASLQLRWGAAGYEFDRRDVELGSPPRSVLLASSVRFNASHLPMLDDQLWFASGRDGRFPTDPHVAGRPHPFVRSDVTYLEYPNGGAVFAAGAISWDSCLSAHGYQNSVSRVTENVLRAFMKDRSGLAAKRDSPV
jgi:N,N-dimethylformamidase